MRVAVLVSILCGVAACRDSPAKKTCAGLHETFLTCPGDRSATKAAAGSLYDMCVIALPYAEDDAQVVDAGVKMYATMFADCAPKPDCEAVTSCFDAHDCAFILTSPEDRTPELFCRLE